jgi:hypothetical protein
MLAVVPARAELALRIGVDQTRYLLGEPLLVRVDVSNQGANDVVMIRDFDPGVGFLAFVITSPAQPSHKYQPWGHGDYGPGGLAQVALQLAPGEHYSGVVDLTYEIVRESRTRASRVPLLSCSGEYVLRATYAIRAGAPGGPLAISSNELHFVVSEPEGVDRAAYEVLKRGARSADRGPWNAYAEQADCYETLLRQYPDSGYAIHAQFYLAQVYELDGELAKRGTPAGAAAMENAAALYASVAEQARDMPLGVYAMRLSARCRAKLGDPVQANTMLEQAFLSAAATDQDRLEALSWMRHVESGLFHEESGLAHGKVATAKARLPLRRVARALGLSASWDPETKTMKISGRKVRAALRPGEDFMLVNGQQRTGVRTWLANGEARVSLSVVATLMAEQRGGGVANALSGLVARAPKPRKPQIPARG